MRESRVWTWIMDHCPTDIAIERMEVLHPPGMADCFWTDKNTRISGWLELKYCEPGNREYKAGRIPKIKPEQPMFLSRQARKNVPAGILLRVGMDTWHLWRAERSPDWNNLMRSSDAMGAVTRSWVGSIDEKLALRSIVDLLLDTDIRLF